MTEQKEDLLLFDGACEPNPGGRLGWGWQIQCADGTLVTGQGERAPQPANTVNVAEYSGLIAGLRAYVAGGGQGPLLVQGDSQLIIYQMDGRYGVSNPSLAALNDEAQEILCTIPGMVRFNWVRREFNAVADRLAAGLAADAPLPSRTYLADVEQTPIATPVRAAIQRLNTHPGPGFGDLAKLRVGGRDALSELRLADLQARAGEAAVTAITTAFPDQPLDQAAVLRWALRGLALELAIRKGQIDAEIHAHAEEKSRRAGGS
jgi:ribonuclease HI